MEGLIVISVVVLVVIWAALVISIPAAFRRQREKTFRESLRGWDYSETEVDKAVKEQEW